MSDSERPELRAFRELELLVHHLSDELASFRRRALTAEARLRDIEGGAAGAAPLANERIADLEHDNAALRSRIHNASERTRQILDRVHFLRQQAQEGER